RVEQRHDPRVGQAGEQLHLVVTAALIAQFVDRRREALDRDIPPEGLVAGTEHLARAANAGPLEEPISAVEQFTGQQQGHPPMLSRIEMRRIVLEPVRMQAYSTPRAPSPAAAWASAPRRPSATKRSAHPKRRCRTLS